MITMNKYTGMIVLLAVCLLGFRSYAEENISGYLQDISVTIKTKSGEGSGVVFTRDVACEGGVKKVNFVWTAAHVLESLRSTRNVLGSDGTVKKVTEFQDAEIIKKLVQEGRTVGQLTIDARVVKYSDAKDGEDLALLLIRKFNFVDVSAKFYKDDKNSGVALGTQLYHVGSLLGETGSNSMTTGIMSQVGRMVSVNGGTKVLFDQTTVTAFPGSSGGGVFLTNGEYIGMLVRGAGETFNLIVPMRRIVKWAQKENMMWALDATVVSPSLEQIESASVESMGKADVSSGSGSLIFP